jgi:UDP-N-acetyl-D-mannosaminuronic acid dehydrogenase
VFSLGYAAMQVNEGLPGFVVEQLAARLPLSELTVGVLGMAFKPESDDVRSSLSYKLKKLLERQAKAVLTTDPFVRTDPALIPLERVIEESDVLILAVPHKAYGKLDTRGKPLVDIANLLGKGSA